MLVTEQTDPVPILENEKSTLVTPEQKKLIIEGDVVEQMILKDKITRFGNRQATLKKNIGKVYELIWTQCTTSIKTMVKGKNDYESKKKGNDVIWLIKRVRELASGVDNNTDAVDIYFQSLWEWTRIRQGENESKEAYQKRADTATQNLILAGGKMFYTQGSYLVPSMM